MDLGPMPLIVSLAGAVAALAGAAWFAGRVGGEVPSVAALAAGVALAVMAWLPPPVTPIESAAGVALDPVLLSGDQARTELAPPPPAGRAPPLPGREVTPIRVEATEAEPNDTLPSGNLAMPGVAIAGSLGAGDRDWFAVDIAKGTRGRLVATVVTEEASVTMTLFDDAGQALGIARTIDEVRVRTATLERGLDRPRYYLLLMPATDVAARYQLTVGARRW
jgi:hypothetical protein